jgi:hypothetical protein
MQQPSTLPAAGGCVWLFVGQQGTVQHPGHSNVWGAWLLHALRCSAILQGSTLVAQSNYGRPAGHP